MHRWPGLALAPKAGLEGAKHASSYVANFSRQVRPQGQARPALEMTSPRIVGRGDDPKTIRQQRNERMNMQTTSRNKSFTGSPTLFTLQAPETCQVSLAGDFNNWDTKAAPMQKGPDGIWRLSLPLTPGRYEYRFYADGVWQDDPAAKQRATSALGTQNCVRLVSDGLAL